MSLAMVTERRHRPERVWNAGGNGSSLKGVGRQVTMRRIQFQFRYAIAIVLVLSVAGLLMAQTAPSAPPRKSLVVEGKTVDGAVIQVDGRSYVDLEALAAAVGGSVTIEPSRVTLNMVLPAATAASTQTAAAPAPVESAPAALPDAMSRDFMRTSIAMLSEMREWRGAVGVVVSTGIPVTGTWPQDYRDRVEASLAQASVAATNGADRDALELLQNEYGNLQSWADAVIGARQSLNAAQSVDPNALANDKMLQKLTACSQFLSSMLVSGTYTDNSNCH
jgi:hypothetical protein